MEKREEERETRDPSAVIRLMRRIAREVITTVVPALLIALFVNVHIAEAVEIESGPSMQPNLYQGYRVMIEKVSYRFRLPDRGEIVVVDRPGEEVSLIKRVLALPGETVEVRGGHVWIDGCPVVEPWVTHYGGADDGPVAVPAGHVYILGDNRRQSRDSRMIGPVPLCMIEGRVWLVYRPLDQFRIVP